MGGQAAGTAGAVGLGCGAGLWGLELWGWAVGMDGRIRYGSET